MKIRGYGATDSGTERKSNQDSLVVSDEHWLYLICDGMGGHQGGEIASQVAARVVSEYIKALRAKNGGSLEPVAEQGISIAQSAVEEACAELCRRIEEEPALRGMGTTLTMLLVLGSRAVMAHVGDSRLYLFRRGRTHKLSRDHTLVSTLISQGAMTSDQAKASPIRHVLTRALGQFERVEVDTLMFDLLPGDRFLLCSDGILPAFEDLAELGEILASRPVAQIPERLTALARERDGDDNATAIIVEIADEADARAHYGEVMIKLDTLWGVYLFADLELEELLLIIDLVQVIDCRRGETLIREGDAGDKMYIILGGRFSVRHAGAEVAVLEQGNHFGEMALLDDSPRNATVTALEESRLLMLERAALTNLIKRESALGSRLLYRLALELSRRLTRANQQIYRLSSGWF